MVLQIRLQLLSLGRAYARLPHDRRLFHVDALEKVKQLIVNSSALAILDPASPTLVFTDASDYGLGGVFTQIHAD